MGYLVLGAFCRTFIKRSANPTKERQKGLTFAFPAFSLKPCTVVDLEKIEFMYFCHNNKLLD